MKFYFYKKLDFFYFITYSYFYINLICMFKPAVRVRPDPREHVDIQMFRVAGYKDRGLYFG